MAEAEQKLPEMNGRGKEKKWQEEPTLEADWSELGRS